jgi:hypothetical protein
MMTNVLHAICKSARLLRAIMQEIFDESAYQRFLRLNHLQASKASYAQFQSESAMTKSQKPRCC